MLSNLEKYYREPLYRNSIAIMLNSAFAALFGLLFWIVAARIMSSNDIGLATAAISAAALIQVLSRLGMDAGLVRYLPESNNKNGLYSIVAIVTLAVALFLTAVFISGLHFFSPALVFMREGFFLPLLVVYVTISSLYSTQNMALIVIRRADLSFVQNLLLGIRIPILFFVVSLSVLGVFYALSSAFIITYIFGALVLYRCGISFTQNLDIIELKNILKYSVGNYSANILMMMPLSIVPIMVVNTLGAEESAYYYIAYTIAGLLHMIPSAVSMSLFVEASHNLSLKENVIKSIKFTMLLLIPALIFILLFGDKLLLLFNKEYSEQSFDILKLLATSSIFSAVTSIYLSIKKIQKDIRMINYVSFTLSALIIGFGYVSMLKYGLVGLGYTWLGANALVCLFVIGMVLGKEKWF
jgi:O-antigen/teichoic acid export membrane protein